MNRIRFKSKRNEVVYDRVFACVVKRFADHAGYLAEKEVYLQLNRLEETIAPRLLGWNDESCVLHIEYIDGKTVLSHLEEMEKENKLDDAVRLMLECLDFMYRMDDALSSFGEGYVQTDVNLRNFIVSSRAGIKRIYGIDFEDVASGDLTDKTAEVVAMYLMYTPEKSTFKTNVCARIMTEVSRKWGISLEMSLIDEHLVKIRERRQSWNR